MRNEPKKNCKDANDNDKKTVKAKKKKISNTYNNLEDAITIMGHPMNEKL